MKRLFTLLLLSALLCPFTGDASNAATKKTRRKRKPRTEQAAEQPAPTPQTPAADTLAAPPALPDPAPQPVQAAVANPWKERAVVASTPQERDSLLNSWLEQTAVNSFENFFNDFILIDTACRFSTQLPDSVYQARLRAMISPIQLPYNSIVRTYIDRYTSSRTGTMSHMLGLSQYYFPMIEQELVNAGLPVELRTLPIIESALAPTARSRVGATGLWQFMYTTGKAYGLEINSFVDERCDPLRSTQAACRYLSDLYKTFGDWTLVLAAYNCGPGNVNKAIARAGGGERSFWEIYEHLPRETRRYVPAFIAATYAFTYHRQHEIEVTEPPLPLATDTLMIDRVLHLDQVASTLDIPLETLRRLNPQYRMDIIPATNKPYPLTLPVRDVTQYIARREAIVAKDSLYLKNYLDPANIDKVKAAENSTAMVVHRVKSGENLGAIALKYGVTVRQIMNWNGLRNANKLSIGQRLRIQRRR